jgi:hypothetical protein
MPSLCLRSYRKGDRPRLRMMKRLVIGFETAGNHMWAKKKSRLGGAGS